MAKTTKNRSRSTRWTLTDEHRKKIPEWNRRWVDIIMSTAPMTDDDRRITSEAIRGIYAAAGLASPVNIVYVASPLMAAFVAAAASVVWQARQASARSTIDATGYATQDATRAATSTATYDAIYDATSDALRNATIGAAHDATRDATRAATSTATYDAIYDVTGAALRNATIGAAHDATYAATCAATYSATEDATYAATCAATYSATRDASLAVAYVATYSATSAATHNAIDDVTGDKIVDAMMTSVHDAVRAIIGQDRLQTLGTALADINGTLNGGNHWASWCCFLSFVRDVIGWHHPTHDAYAHYERAAIHSSRRFMHQRFCIVSDRPRVLRTVSRGGVLIPHCEDGPSHEWSDGWRLWHIDGVRVTEQVVMRPGTLTVEQINRETNNDVRSIMLNRFGVDRYIRESGASRINSRTHPRDGTTERLYTLPVGVNAMFVIDPSTDREVPLLVPDAITTCEDAQAWLSHGADKHAMCRT